MLTIEIKTKIETICVFSFSIVYRIFMYKKEVMQVYVVEKPFVCDKSCDLIKKIGIRYMSAINKAINDMIIESENLSIQK